MTKLFFTCKNLYFVNNEVSAGCPKLGPATLLSLFFMCQDVPVPDRGVAAGGARGDHRPQHPRRIGKPYYASKKFIQIEFFWHFHIYFLKFFHICLCT